MKCPFCGADVNDDAKFCSKYSRELSNHVNNNWLMAQM